jgi:hypothetical protein
MTDNPSNVSGSVSNDEVAGLLAEQRAMNFAKNLLYSCQLNEVVPLIEELEEYDSDDPRIDLINAVVNEALEGFPPADCDV